MLVILLSWEVGFRFAAGLNDESSLSLMIKDGKRRENGKRDEKRSDGRGDL